MSERLAMQERLPVGAMDTRALGWWAMIFTIFTEASLFAYLLFSYYYLAIAPHANGMFPQGGPPSLALALPNTLILLLSSLTAAIGQRSVARDAMGRTALWLAISAILGIVFLGIQALEWHNKTFTLASSPYSSLYFTITGFHMAHVAAGVIALAFLALWTSLGYFNHVRWAYIHIGALYWHFVDAVWIVIFFTFYVTPLLGLRS